MTKKMRQTGKTLSEADRLYERADKEWSRGRLRSAFRLFLDAAKAGKVQAYYIVGSFYDVGQGVAVDEDAALYWYRRAYSYSSDDSAANNIGCIWRDRGNLSRAIWWLKRAVEAGDDDANLNIAKIYLMKERSKGKALPYLHKVRKSRDVTEGSKEEAMLLLKEIKRKRA